MTITASTHLITDAKTMANGAFSAATLNKATAAGTDIAGMAKAAERSLQEAARALTLIAGLCDASDAQLVLIEDLQATLV